MEKKIKTHLILILILVGVVPFGVSYFMVEGLFSYQNEMAHKLEVNQLADAYGESLKELSKYNPSRELTYKKSFEEIQEKKLLLAKQDGLMQKVSQSLKKVYFVVFGVISLILFFIGSFLSKKISNSYNETYAELQEKKERERYLSQFEKISNVIKSINHEMKKPLAPIEVWNQNIMSSYAKDGDKFFETLEFGNKVISEEVGSLKNIINSFNVYTSLPEPQFEEVNIEEFVKEIALKFNEVYEELLITVKVELLKGVLLKVDKKLFSQVFQNLIENALEANPEKPLDLRIIIFLNKGLLFLDVENKGVEVVDRLKIFEPQFTTKKEKNGAGLGLSISKVTILKHGGDLEALPFKDGAKFRITLPLRGDA
ncbi:MAG: sensor histidine kinase [Bdellovibrionales bacterium]